MNESMITEYQTKKDKFDREVGTMSTAVRQIEHVDTTLFLLHPLQEFSNVKD